MSAVPRPRRERRRYWNDGDPVVREPKFDGVPVPVFGEDAWHLACLHKLPNKEAVTLHFSDLAGERKLLAKELMANRLNYPSISSRRSTLKQKVAPPTCSQALYALKSIYRFMDGIHVAMPADLGQEHLNLYLRSLDRFGSRMSAARALKPFVWLWEERDELTSGGLSFDPFGGRSVNIVAGWTQPKTNLTPRVPPKVMAAILRAALTYIDHFADDIIKAERELSEDGDEPPPGGDRLSRLRSYLSELARDARGCPAIFHLGQVRPANQLIARRAGVPRRWLTEGRARAEVLSAMANLGAGLVCFRAPAYIPEGWRRPWRDGMTPQDVRQECRFLIAAAFIVVGYLSGMRNSEIQDLRHGCHKVTLDEHGEVERHRLRGRTFKRQEPPYPDREWVVIEPVARAIRVLERLTAGFRTIANDDHLFVKLHFEAGEDVTVRTGINPTMREFMAHWNELVAAGPAARSDGGNGVLEPIPDHDGQPWDLRSNQFRRTLAWHIANQPFGEIGAMIQFGHAYVQITEGYCGSVEDGFMDEVEAERFAARTGDLAAMFDDACHGIRPAGPMADELNAVFAEGMAVMGPFPGELAGDRRVMQLLKLKAHQMRLGPLAHCFYVPGRARCQRDLESSGRREPVFGLCDPNCRNACWTKDHLDTWRSIRSEAERLRKRNGIGLPQREVLGLQIAQADHVIKSVLEAGVGQQG